MTTGGSSSRAVWAGKGFFRQSHGDEAAARDEARCIAANLAKLPVLLKRQALGLRACISMTPSPKHLLSTGPEMRSFHSSLAVMPSKSPS